MHSVSFYAPVIANGLSSVASNHEMRVRFSPGPPHIMPYAGYCQGCVNDTGIGRACGQNPLGYCDKHLVETYKFVKTYGVDFPPYPGFTQEQLNSEIKQYEDEIRSRGLEVPGSLAQ